MGKGRNKREKVVWLLPDVSEIPVPNTSTAKMLGRAVIIIVNVFA